MSKKIVNIKLGEVLKIGGKNQIQIILTNFLNSFNLLFKIFGIARKQNNCCFKNAQNATFSRNTKINATSKNRSRGS